MANTKITSLTDIAAVPANADVMAIVDVSDTTMAASGTTKKVRADRLFWTNGTANTVRANIDANSMNITNAGTIAIGTATPGARLHLHGNDANASTGPNFRVTTSADSHPLVQLLSWSHDNITWAFDSYYNGSNWISSDVGSNFQFLKFGDLFTFKAAGGYTAGSVVTWTTAININNAGSVGFNKAPSYLVDVNGQCHASSFPTSSDARLKENLEPISGVLDKLNTISAYKFDWKDDYSGVDQFRQDKTNPNSKKEKQVGFIAQEVFAEFPELITRWKHEAKRRFPEDLNIPKPLDLNDAMAVDYGRMVPILVQAIKELKEKISQLEARVTALE